MYINYLWNFTTVTCTAYHHRHHVWPSCVVDVDPGIHASGIDGKNITELSWARMFSSGEVEQREQGQTTQHVCLPTFWIWGTHVFRWGMAVLEHKAVIIQVKSKPHTHTASEDTCYVVQALLNHHPTHIHVILSWLCPIPSNNTCLNCIMNKCIDRRPGVPISCTENPC